MSQPCLGAEGRLDGDEDAGFVEGDDASVSFADAEGEVFEGIDQELPALTVGLIATSDFLRDYGLWLLVVIGVAVSALPENVWV